MRALIGRHLPKIVFLLALLPGLAMTLAVHLAGERRLQAEFERAGEIAIDRILSRLEQHVVVLRAARGLLSATRGGLSRDEFVRFLASVDLNGDLSGLQGVGFARMLSSTDHMMATQEIQRNYGLEMPVHPESQQPWVTPIVLLEPATERNVAALGFDMYSESTRRSAMDHAAASGEAQMTGPVELVQEITQDKQAGFLIYLPFASALRPQGAKSVPVDGFIYAPFRGGDLIRAALAAGTTLPVTLKIVDSGAATVPLFDNTAAMPGPIQLTRSVAVFGRLWQFDIRSDVARSLGLRAFDSVVLGLTSLLFAAAAAYAVSARQAEAAQARELARAASREAEYRALSLQEMKHRIKNHIARIQSIARQSARTATDLKAFATAFDARLQAMSAVQEILAGTAAAKADIRNILATELEQAVDAGDIPQMLGGPLVTLNEDQAQAFALVVHELVTNAMKYGGLSGDRPALSVVWSIGQADTAGQELALEWIETLSELQANPQGPPGFGSRLIEASLKGQLSGRIERTFAPGRFTIRISFPLHP